ncbi:hypothetical protein L9F63_022868, partial [Diploptera punctata]
SNKLPTEFWLNAFAILAEYLGGLMFRIARNRTFRDSAIFSIVCPYLLKSTQISFITPTRSKFLLYGRVLAVLLSSYILDEDRLQFS